MLFEQLKYQLENQLENDALIINEHHYSYGELANKIANIQQLLLQDNFKIEAKTIIYTYDDLETYAAILSVWFLGGTFIPINPKHPKKRNQLILDQVLAKHYLSSKNDKNCINTTITSNKKAKIIYTKRDENTLMYILFTSGSTGTPKGVPISYKNINSFITDFAEEYKLNKQDKFLQIYDLTFDASIHCYLLPLYLGASIYTVSPNKIKYLEAYKLMDKQQLTFAKFPPSVLAYLKPFFNKINLPKLKYSLLGGESLNLDLITSWQNCAPNATIQNVYGPTEATINTHIYTIPKNNPKTYNGVLSIGKPFKQNKAFIIDENNQLITNKDKGELCLYGNQITNNYFNDLEKTKQAFVIINNQLVYKTGDLVYKDNDGDYLFCGRIDSQVQIQGYRIELSEIENAARKYQKAINYKAVTKTNKLNVLEIVLFTEKLTTETTALLNFLKTQLPNYMIPSKIINLDVFPKTAGGKIDIQSLIKTLK